MRDEHRTRQELCLELGALRKQVADLKAAMVARRRVEDALRRHEQQLLALADGAPAGLCLLHPDGAPVVANRPLARVLGYDSPGELVSIGVTLGLLGCPNQLGRIRAALEQGTGAVPELVFRRKDAARLTLDVSIARLPDSDGIVLLVGLPDPSEPARATAD
jgi:PAS domain-containing protein